MQGKYFLLINISTEEHHRKGLKSCADMCVYYFHSEVPGATSASQWPINQIESQQFEQRKSDQ